jgi:manganese/zinc/iron transport system ATP- binding protein
LSASGEGREVPANGDGDPAIEVMDLTVAYRDKPVLWDVDMSVGRGVLMAIVGPNGAGKTTLIKAILGLVDISAGRVLIGGRPYEQQRRRVAYVPQRGSVDWDFPTTVLDVVMMGRYGALGWIKRPGARERQAASEALEKVAMSDYAHRQISQLSGGQQQRVAVARALVARPQVVFADEPTGNLDTRSGQEILGFLRSAVDLHDQSIVMVTHDPNAAAWADHVVFVVDGRVHDVMDRPTADSVLDVVKGLGR